MDNEFLNKFRKAVRSHQLAELRKCLDQDRSLANAPLFDFGQRPIAASHGHHATIDLLLEYGADINLKSDWKLGPWGVLDMADEATAEFLISRGAIVDIFGATHLNQLDRMRELLDADPSLVHAKGGDGCRPLHFAKTIEAIDLLLSRGADLDARDDDHRSTAAQWSMPRPPEESPHRPNDADGRNVMRWLVDRGASGDVFMFAALDDVPRLKKLIEADPTTVDVRVGDKNYAPCPSAPGDHIYYYKLSSGRTAIEIASAFGSQAAMELLISHSSPRQRFLAACAMGDEAMARDVLKANQNLISPISDADQNALSNAAWNGKQKAVRLMLDLGFDPLIAPAKSGTALHCAAWQGRAAIVGNILQHPSVQRRLADVVNAKESTHNSTPIGWCCHGSQYCKNPAGDYPTVARLLLDAGATVGPNLNDASAEVLAVINAKLAG